MSISISLRQHLRHYHDNYLFMLGHLATDICQGSVGAALAVLLAAGYLHTNTEISMLVLASTLLSSIVQPLVGIISDLKPRPWIMTVGMVTAALGIGFIGCTQNFILMFILISISGVGVAMFHPQGSRLCHACSHEHMGQGMSIFSVGGNIGFAIGPVIISLATLLFGPPGIMVIMLPALIMMFVFMNRHQHYTELTLNENRELKSQPQERESYAGFAILTMMIFFRSCVYFGLTTFIPLYFMSRFKWEVGLANGNLTVIAVCSALATLAGGTLADRFGFKTVLAMSATLAVPFLIAFAAMDSAGLAVAFLIPAALFLYGSLSVSMVMGQKLLCNHIGFASGITIGLGISFGGITSPLLGYIGDHYGLEYTMWTIVVAAMISALVAWFVPDIDAIRQKRKEAAQAAAASDAESVTESAAAVTSETENHS